MEDYENPPEFICPITHEIMTDPVVASDGNSYQRSALVEWIETRRKTSPVTNVDLEPFTFVENRNLLKSIEEWENRKLHIKKDAIQMVEDKYGKMIDQMIGEKLSKAMDAMEIKEESRRKEEQIKKDREIERARIKAIQEYKRNTICGKVKSFFVVYLNIMRN